MAVVSEPVSKGALQHGWFPDKLMSIQCSPQVGACSQLQQQLHDAQVVVGCCQVQGCAACCCDCMDACPAPQERPAGQLTPIEGCPVQCCPACLVVGVKRRTPVQQHLKHLHTHSTAAEPITCMAPVQSAVLRARLLTVVCRWLHPLPITASRRFLYPHLLLLVHNACVGLPTQYLGPVVQCSKLLQFLIRTSTWPLVAAQCRGKSPSLSCFVRLAPLSTKAFTTAAWLLIAARCRGRT